MARIDGLGKIGDRSGHRQVVGLQHFGVDEERAAVAQNRGVVVGAGIDRVKRSRELREHVLLLLQAFEVVGRDRDDVGFDPGAFGDELAAELGRAEALHEVLALEAVGVKRILHGLLGLFVGVRVDDDGRGFLRGSRRFVSALLCGRRSGLVAAAR